MPVCITLPDQLEATLRCEIADLDLAAKEALLVELYRRERITKHEMATALGIDRFEANDLLTHYGVTDDLPTADDIEAEVLAVEALMKR